MHNRVSDFFCAYSNLIFKNDTERNESIQRIVDWLETTQRWNRKIDLTAVRSEEELVELALLDACTIVQNVDLTHQHIVDVGTGFGGPGLAMALLHNDCSITLVEPLAKRVSFLRSMIGSLHLTDRVELCATQAEAVIASHRTFEIAVSRATFAPTQWLALGHQLAPQGQVVVLLARDEVPTHPMRVITKQHQYVTRMQAQRSVVVYSPI